MELKDKVKQFFDLVLLNQESGTGLYKYFGGFWEVIYPIFKKYDPDDLNKYEKLVNDNFDYFNPEIENIIDTGSEESNWKAGIDYFNYRRQYYSASDIHYIYEPDDDLPKPYIPNQNLDNIYETGQD